MKMAVKSQSKMTLKTLQLEYEILKKQLLGMNDLVQKIQKREEKQLHEVHDLKKRIIQLETALNDSKGDINKRMKQHKTIKKKVSL